MQMIDLQLIQILEESTIPRTAWWLRRRLDSGAAIHIYSALHRLVDDGRVVYCNDGTWHAATTGKNPPEITTGTNRDKPFDPKVLVGPIWEPKVADELRSRGLPIEQQKHVLSYYLDIAVKCRNGEMLNVEVDGRSHRRSDGERKTGDIIRDARLRAEGWHVHRIWVRDLMKDFDRQIDLVVELWNRLSGEP